MSSIIKALKSIYDFFAGDLIILIATALAFGLSAIAEQFHTGNVVIVAIFIVLILIGLVVTLGREIAANNAAKRSEGDRQ